MASSMISNPVTNSDRSRDSKRKKNKSHSQNRDHHQHNLNQRTRWKTDAEQKIYSSKLLRALRQVRQAPYQSSAPRRARAVREAAYRVLAVAAKGRTRWSRAILTNRLKFKFMKHKRVHRAPISVARPAQSKKPKVSILRFKAKNLAAVHRKARLLSRLIPGCGQEPLPVILEEATDYIPALEMQIRAMTSLVQLLSGSGSGAGSSLSATTQPGSSRSPPY